MTLIKKVGDFWNNLSLICQVKDQTYTFIHQCKDEQELEEFQEGKKGWSLQVYTSTFTSGI